MSRTGGLYIAMTAAALALGGATVQAQQVGTASAVNPAATANLKTIVIGQSIAHKEHIQTKASGSVQLLFLDKTSMTIGPNSDLTIDEYVYDPKANTGKLAATLGKGALRFVGGQISHNGDAEIKTASALIGIRGGVMMTDGKGGIYSGYGTMTVTSGGRSVALGAGEFTQTQAGAPPTPPDLPPPGFVQQQIAVFQSASGQTGGVRAGAASAKNIATAAQRATGSSNGMVTGSGAPPTPAPPPIVEQLSAISSAFTQSIQISNQAEAVQQIAQDQLPDHSPPDNHNPLPTDNNTPPPNARPSVTLRGYAGGLYIVTGNQTSVTGTSEITLDAANNRVQGNLDIYAFDSRNPFTQLAGTFHALFEFGSKGSSGPANSAYVDYNNFYANTPNNSVVNGVPVNGVMVSANGAATSQIVNGAIPNLTPCQCEYTRWGFWSVESTSAHPNNTAQTPREVLVGTWVAGRPVGSIGDVPTIGQATYTGHVIANVNDGSFVAGGFSNTVDFAARTGAVSVTNLDNTNYSGNVNFNTDPRNFGGTIAGNNNNRSMTLQGSFFQGPSSPVGEMGGRVGISGDNNYLGSGIFAATKR
ncbi:FecR domain-containing protein [Nitrobacter sp. TKz-YC02]|uniref:FecR domain-containing protein n=1 Tax=Nitrobacter sp. TKz-YC02 TaxID=3398704 RepID=UPI003CF6916B